MLVYCWRGGERSLSLSHVLSRCGFDVSLVSGGYKAYRRQVRQFCDVDCGRFTYHVIAGRTGSAKGKLLNTITAAGGQVRARCAVLVITHSIDPQFDSQRLARLARARGKDGFRCVGADTLRVLSTGFNLYAR